MKSFSNFLKEVTTSASQKAAQMGLSGDGHGGWYDKQGKFVAKTIRGQLKFYGSRGSSSTEEPSSSSTKKPEEGSAKSASKSPQTQQQSQPPEKPKVDAGPITVGFGRFNPPTVGHEKLLNKISSVAGKGGQYRIYPSRSHDPEKNPLDPSEKITYMRQMFPDHANSIIDDEKTRTIFDVLKAAHAKGYSSVNIVVGSDRVGEFENLANKYNGSLYDFDKINIISAGKRDADAKGVEGMSASKLRAAASKGDYDSFREAFVERDENGEIKRELMDDKTTKQLFNTLRKSMNVKSETWKISPKLDLHTLRENYVNEKIYRLDEWVENLNTGLVGNIIRRGANYVIAVTKEGYMFKSWLKDLTEYTEKKMDRMMRDKIHPNMLVGTTGALKNVAKTVPGSYPIINKLRKAYRRSS